MPLKLFAVFDGIVADAAQLHKSVLVDWLPKCIEWELVAAS